ncbi:MAG: prephenate dehydrogenase [Clostridia bacterium]|nr:prephenate dehydrogenase [Clostridia bacterium]
MNVGIVGLGLIGGSAAKAYKAQGADYTVYGYNRNKVINDYAKLSDVIDDYLTDENISACDLIILAVYPDAAVEFLKNKSAIISKNTIVIDFCGTKRKICEAGFALAEKYGYTFVGGHPMAGTQYSGLKYSKKDLFKGASMIIVPPTRNDISLLARVKECLAPLSFGRFNVTNAEFHDSEIAYTSQLAHIVSNAYVKSPAAQTHKGYSAGSYRDLTRVAWLNENMWTQLFMENKEYLLKELSIVIDSLNEYKTALENSDEDMLRNLLKEGRECKERADG